MTYTADGEKLTKAAGATTKNYISGIEYTGANLEANLRYKQMKKYTLLLFFVYLACKRTPEVVSFRLLPTPPIRDTVFIDNETFILNEYYDVVICNTKFDTIEFGTVKLHNSNNESVPPNLIEEYNPNMVLKFVALPNYGFSDLGKKIPKNGSDTILFLLQNYFDSTEVNKYRFSVKCDSMGVVRKIDFFINSNIDNVNQPILIK